MKMDQTEIIFNIALVSRHEMTIKHIKETINITKVFRESVEISDLEDFDMVLGNLPISLIAELTKLGIHVGIVEFDDFPPRGVELSSEELKKFGFRIEFYEAVKIKNLLGY